ncbi:unnamed protein product [Bathycoccus prasinos]
MAPKKSKVKKPKVKRSVTQPAKGIIERTICSHPMLKRVQKEVRELKKKSTKKHCLGSDAGGSQRRSGSQARCFGRIQAEPRGTAAVDINTCTFDNSTCEIYSSCSAELSEPFCHFNYGNSRGCGCNAGRTVDARNSVIKRPPRTLARATTL